MRVTTNTGSSTVTCLLIAAVSALVPPLVIGYLGLPYPTPPFLLAVLAGLGGALLLGFLIAKLMTRQTTQQMQHLSTLFDDFTHGNFAARATIVGNNALGQVAQRVNHLLDNSMPLAQYQTERETLQASLSQLGHDMQKTAEHLQQGSTAQATHLATSSAALTAMTTSIQHVSENATLAATTVEQSLTNMRQGVTAVQHALQSMQRVQMRVEETAKCLKRLEERSQTLSDLGAIVGGIAEHTSVLALNTSVQAARAGESGQPFVAVVQTAEDLSKRAEQVTKQLADLSRTMRGEVKEAGVGMQDSSQAAAEGSQVTAQAEQALGEIASVSTRLTEVLQALAQDAGQQSQGAESLSKAMDEMSETSEQTAMGIQQATASVSHLVSLANDLQSVGHTNGQRRSAQMPA